MNTQIHRYRNIHESVDIVSNHFNIQLPWSFNVYIYIYIFACMYTIIIIIYDDINYDVCMTFKSYSHDQSDDV